MSTARLPRSRSAKLQGPPAPRRRPHMRPQEPPRHGSTRLAAHVPIRPRTFRVVLCVVRRRRATAWRDAGDAHGCGAARIGCGRSSSRPTTRLARAHAVVVSRSALGSQVTRLTSAQRGLSPKQTAGRESVPAEQTIERGKALSATPPPENKWTRDVRRTITSRLRVGTCAGRTAWSGLFGNRGPPPSHHHKPPRPGLVPAPTHAPRRRQLPRDARWAPAQPANASSASSGHRGRRRCRLTVAGIRRARHRRNRLGSGSGGKGSVGAGPP